MENNSIAFLNTNLTSTKVPVKPPLLDCSLNNTLLEVHYGVKKWVFPDENLCPPIPGRADYIHYAADLLGETNFGRIPTGKNITCIDIGVGASCIYPIIGVTEYDWNFIASDTNQKAIDSAKNIISSNSALTDKIDCRLQNNAKDIFYGIITREGKIDICICNPPFHSSAEDALKGTQRKVKNLTGKKTDTPQLNFSGINDELIYEGGESRFISAIIRESVRFYKNCFWFTTLVSKQSNLRGVYKALEKTKATQVKTIPMGTGNKSSRIVAWTFLTQTEQKEWRETRWNTKKSK